jgi:GNAT superfamily N-acetyltransferase
MSSIEVRPFRRSDREQLTELVNAHAAAIVPGLGVSVAVVLSQLERQPGEFVVDPWVRTRATLVAEQDQRVTAAAHLLRYAADERVSPAYRDAGEIHWLVFWPEPAYPGAAGGARAADELMAASLRQLGAWGVRHQYAGGELPVRGVYGVPRQWPHVRSLYERSGFRATGQVEIVFAALIDDLRPLGATRPAGLPELTVRRSVGSAGTRLSAVTGDEVIGYVEAEVFDDGERRARHGNWADVGNLHVTGQYRRRGVATWLLGQLAGWLHLAHVDRLLAYTYLEGRDETGQGYDSDRAFLRALPFTELTQTARGWTRNPAR